MASKVRARSTTADRVDTAAATLARLDAMLESAADELARMRTTTAAARRALSGSGDVIEVLAFASEKYSALRPMVQRLAAETEAVLARNDHKGGWEDMPPSDMLARLREETDELGQELEVVGDIDPSEVAPRQAAKIRREAADVAAFAGMIIDRFTP